MILGSRMTREDLLEYIRTRRREAEEKHNYQPPPPPPTERQRAQTELEIATGQRRLAHFAALEVRRRPEVMREKVGTEIANEADATSRDEQSGSSAAAAAGQDANEADVTSRAEGQQPC
jgi:hypothetical protein